MSECDEPGCKPGVSILADEHNTSLRRLTCGRRMNGIYIYMNMICIWTEKAHFTITATEQWKTLVRKNRMTLPTSPCGAIMIPDIL